MPDLVVDAGGRRSMLGEWLTAAGAAAPVEERADSGYVYYGRHYRSADGAMPPMLGAAAAALRVDVAADPASRQRLLVGRHHGERQGSGAAASRATSTCGNASSAAIRSAAHWIDAEAVTGIDVMAKIDDRVRRFDPATAPTGIVAVGDSAACTNPSIGRGATLAFMHAVCLRDVLRDGGTGDAIELARRWRQASAERVEPFVTDTLTLRPAPAGADRGRDRRRRVRDRRTRRGTSVGR